MYIIKWLMVAQMLEEMVKKKKDIIAFEPMKPQDRAQVCPTAFLSDMRAETLTYFAVVYLIFISPEATKLSSRK
jgi:hypothetical protein